MTIILRVSKNSFGKPLPFNIKDKYELVTNCYNSFINANSERYKVIAIGDSFPEEWKVFFPDVHKWIDVHGLGNEGTFRMQLEIAKKHKKVLLLEDDYLWRPFTVPLIDKALDKLAFVSPYDHPGHYLEERFSDTFTLKYIDGVVYREAPSNTLTFATTGEMINKHWSTLTSHGIRDHEMFQEIISTGDKMWNPTHSFATHMVDGLLAPNVDWYSLW